MPEDYSEAIASFRRGAEILDAAIARASADESKFVRAPGKWTMRQIVRHLTDCEIVAGMRIRQMIAEDRPLLAVFNQDSWADHLHYNNYDVFDSAAKFRILREDTSDFLAPLPAEEFERVGLHPERGIWTLREWVNHFATHTEKHVQQILSIREAWSRR